MTQSKSIPSVKVSSLELRINSADDARSAVANAPKLIKAMKSQNLDSLEFLIEYSHKSEVMPLLAGAFGPTKVFYTTVMAKQGNEFFALPHFKNFSVAPPTPRKPKQPRMSRDLSKLAIPGDLPTA